MSGARWIWTIGLGYPRLEWDRIPILLGQEVTLFLHLNMWHGFGFPSSQQNSARSWVPFLTLSRVVLQLPTWVK